MSKFEVEQKGCCPVLEGTLGEWQLACKHDNVTLWWPKSLIAVLTPLHKAPSIATKACNSILVHLSLQHCLVRLQYPLRGRHGGGRVHCSAELKGWFIAVHSHIHMTVLFQPHIALLLIQWIVWNSGGHLHCWQYTNFNSLQDSSGTVGHLR